ncbi:tRNA(fMet)-specific endonuclease VapC [Desulfosarcina sp. BuS5]|uniref:type II toxin-antitoxin system VapC family toxin n=1 Tax=Desulfosarcina sp. BuS5 TaxID=933262 RepID=UPI000486512A|nr:type II toxin-antitoxin system VapC family toxin [Desulfosarcina sp. BuS5]WDN87982.1 tRNA(fMet)-specific endonuclease VapC [Desulfosarcina sp. BuS5]
MMKYLIDTNVLSEAVKTVPDKSVMNMLERRQHEIVTAAPVWHELQFGYQRLPQSRKREIIASFLNDIVKRTMLILPYDDRAAEWHAGERARLSSKGLTPPFVDGQIAAISMVNGLILVTRNIDDFKQFLRLKIENWHNA